jgi:hypothetical protein
VERPAPFGTLPCSPAFKCIHTESGKLESIRKRPVKRGPRRSSCSWAGMLWSLNMSKLVSYLLCRSMPVSPQLSTLRCLVLWTFHTMRTHPREDCFNVSAFNVHVAARTVNCFTKCSDTCNNAIIGAYALMVLGTCLTKTPVTPPAFRRVRLLSA